MRIACPIKNILMRPAKQCLPPVISVKIPDRKIGIKKADTRYPYATGFLDKTLPHPYFSQKQNCGHDVSFTTSGISLLWQNLGGWLKK